MSLDADDVATDLDMAAHVGGMSNLQDIIPDEKEWLDAQGAATAKPARTTALKVVMTALGRRRPPIHEEDLVDPTELGLAVSYRALADLFSAAAAHDDSPNLAKSKRFMQLYSDEINSLSPTVQAGVTASSISVRLSRG